MAFGAHEAAYHDDWNINWLFAEDQTLTPPENFKLSTLCEYFGVGLSEEEAHDALADAALAIPDMCLSMKLSITRDIEAVVSSS